MSKDGDYYDRCPHDGCLEVDASHRSEGNNAGAREMVHDWSIFQADPRAGGCGATWTRTTRTGQLRDEKRGVKSLNLTAGAQRSFSLPSEQYRSNYEAIFGHS